MYFSCCWNHLKGDLWPRHAKPVPPLATFWEMGQICERTLWSAVRIMAWYIDIFHKASLYTKWWPSHISAPKVVVALDWHIGILPKLFLRKCDLQLFVSGYTMSGYQQKGDVFHTGAFLGHVLQVSHWFWFSHPLILWFKVLNNINFVFWKFLTVNVLSPSQR